MKTSPNLTELNLTWIEATAATQVRRMLDPHVIQEYADAMLLGHVFPPLIVFNPRGSDKYILADGFHRLEAAKECGYESFPCEMYYGSQHDALEYALSANDDHGLRRTNKDKRNAVELALKDPEWSRWSNAKIARLCRVDDKTVAKVRADRNMPPPDTVKTDRKTKDGDNVAQKQPRKSDVDANERDLRKALDIIKALPFSASHALETYDIPRGDFMYCAEWFAEGMDDA